jgi:hypothetical protein
MKPLIREKLVKYVVAPIIFMLFFSLSIYLWSTDPVRRITVGKEYLSWQEEVAKVNQRLDETEIEMKRLAMAIEYLAGNCEGLINRNYVYDLTGCVNCHWQEG